MIPLAEIPLGAIRLAAQICPTDRGDGPRWQIYIRRYVRTRFKRSKRIGWRWLGWEQDCFPKCVTRVEALRIARHHIKHLSARVNSQLLSPNS